MRTTPKGFMYRWDLHKFYFYENCLDGIIESSEFVIRPLSHTLWRVVMDLNFEGAFFHHISVYLELLSDVKSALPVKVKFFILDSNCQPKNAKVAEKLMTINSLCGVENFISRDELMHNYSELLSHNNLTLCCQVLSSVADNADWTPENSSASSHAVILSEGKKHRFNFESASNTRTSKKSYVNIRIGSQTLTES